MSQQATVERGKERLGGRIDMNVSEQRVTPSRGAKTSELNLHKKSSPDS